MNSKQPILEGTTEPCMKTSDYFQNFPHHIVTFSYDAIVALGLSACEAADSTANVPFTSKEHRDKFARGVFRGASGDFKLRESFPTRTANSSYFVMVNMGTNEINSTHISFKGSPVSSLWETSKLIWEQFQDNNFVYADGSNKLPPELIPEEEERSSYVPTIISSIVACVAMMGAFVYTKTRYNQADSIWSVKIEELHFDDPPTIVGRGTFGLVLLAQYRGTEVAIKRVIPAKEKQNPSREIFNPTASSSVDLEAGREHATRRVSFVQQGVIGEDSGNHTQRKTSIEHIDQRRASIGSQSLRRGSMQMNSSGSRKTHHGVYRFLSTIGGQDEHTTLRKDFIREMRLLSKLRHPCITTVMGAVLDGVHEPMLVMEYMDHGSLYDILHNMTMHLDGEIILPLLKDISQGVRFLHSANPTVIHG